MDFSVRFANLSFNITPLFDYPAYFYYHWRALAKWRSRGEVLEWSIRHAWKA